MQKSDEERTSLRALRSIIRIRYCSHYKINTRLDVLRYSLREYTPIYVCGFKIPIRMSS